MFRNLTISRRIVTILCIVWVMATCRYLILAQDVDRKEPRNLHLVGHEEDPLLARIQNALDDWDPRAMTNPYLIRIKNADQESFKVRRKDLLNFIADPDAAVALGKAFFWEMRAGSDFHEVIISPGTKQYAGTACASCHYRFGADARNMHTSRIPFVAWNQYPLHPQHPAQKDISKPPDLNQGEFKRLPQKNNETVTLSAIPRDSSGSSDVSKWCEPGWKPTHQNPFNVSLIIGSQGIRPSKFKGFMQDANNVRVEDIKILELADEKDLLEWKMFIENRIAHRQVTSRNSPSAYNAVFSDRLFHDGRAESTFNGFSIFGDHDQRQVLYKRSTERNPAGKHELIPVHVAIPHAALASQAVGPIVNEVEMSASGRTFPDLATKLLPAKVLEYQPLSATDSILTADHQKLTYRELIQKAFRREWWDDSDVENPKVDLELKPIPQPIGKDKPAVGSIQQANFGLYWGLSILLYESTLISNDSPFDQMMRGKKEGIVEAWKLHKSRVEKVYLDRAVTDRSKLPMTKEDPDLVDETSKIVAGKKKLGKPGILVEGPEIESTATFQRGMRVFFRNNCHDCHDGPLFSDLYDRTRNDQVTLGIAHIQNHVLFPNAQGDATALALRKKRTSIIDQLAEDLKQYGLSGSLSVRRRAADSVYNLLQLVEGNGEGLLALIVAQFKEWGITNTTNEKALAKFLMISEQELTRVAGNRNFFSERDRIQLASLMIDPLLIEHMNLPNVLKSTRPALPSGGLSSGEPYAFYDAGFYNLGLTLPRFDRGIGTYLNIPGELDDAILESKPEVKEKITQRQATEPNAVKARADVLAEERTAMQAQSQMRQAASGVSGSANQFNASSKTRNARTIAADKRSTSANVPDMSWSRSELYPDLRVEDVYRRRSELHFFSRARDRVIDQEPTGHRKPFLHDNELAFWGSFKTPSLRNVELTAPYMHNGQLQSLEEVISFYERGGFIQAHVCLNPDKHPLIRKMNLTHDDQRALLFFLLCLTDERVRRSAAPFDHPGLVIPNGLDGSGQENWITIKEIGKAGYTNPSDYPKHYPTNK